MDLISDEYRKLNTQLHAEIKEYGASGHRWAQMVRDVARTLAATTILDYGAGKRSLERALGFGIVNYDPAVEEISTPPLPADLVVCTDVLEHIEPDRIDAVLDDLRRLTVLGGFFAVATRPAKKVLADGRNAHLIQQPVSWWMPKLFDRWQVLQMNDAGHEFFVIVRPK